MYYLPYTQFVRLYRDAQEIKDYDMYVAERGWQEWMDNFDLDTVTKTLETVYDISTKNFQELRHETGLTQDRMAYSFGIKKRTLENWESNVNTPPEHDKFFISYIVFLDVMNREDGDNGDAEE